jgi:5-methylcytosine-specific restriction endonuclease McrA
MKKKTTTRKSLVEKTKNLNTWTESEYFSRIRSALRRVFRYYKPMMKALELASRPSQDTSNKRLKKEYQCEICTNWFPRKNVEIDHKIECGSLKTYDDIVPFIKRLTAENPSDYAILCKPCHLKKGKEYKQNLEMSK